MEAALGKSVHGDEVKKEMKAASSDEQRCQEESLFKKANMTKVETSSAELELRGLSPAPKQQEDPLASAKAEMGEMIQENQRLRMHLDRVMKDYRTLEMQFQDIVHQEATKSASTINTCEHHTEEPDFVSLSLGRTLNDAKKDETCKIFSKEEVVEEDKGGIALGLDCNYHEMPKKEAVESSIISPENSVEEVKEEAGETWSPHKRSNGDDGILQQNPAKRARVSVRVRCDTPTMNDGCQWRKYGQKIAKGNPCPRAYYRCTVAPNCPVRKQVQRCAEDMSILTTTYEGTHNHPLPVAATAMASTTSAAASMLLSGSSSSSSGPSNINGLNFYLSDNSKSKPFYHIQNSSSISSSSAFPTITLDLTSSSSSSLSTLNRIGNTNPPPRYSSTNLNFSSFDSNSLPISWSNGVFNYGAPPFNKNQVNSTLDSNEYFALSSFGKQPQENLYQSYLQKHFLNSAQPPLPPDTIAAATKAITSDPSFQSALVSALSSIIGTSNGDNVGFLGNQVLADDKPRQILKLGEPFSVLSSFPSTSNATKCASSFLNNRPSSTNSQQGSFFPLQPSFPFPSSKGKSTSPGENRDHVL